MSGVDSVRELVELIRDNPDECNFTGGLSEQDIARAEAELATTFPPSYRFFLAELGSCEAGGVELLGIYRPPARGDQLLDTVSETLDARNDERFPPDLLVIEYDGMGGIISLDSAQRNENGEYPVVAWDPGADARRGPERLADDFGTYALHRCQIGLR
ncbi:SMI1/KNR4 family protein [Streptomyces sp. FXJ1.172]|uniref:SMI1/KNR4 family protein n=1 Tax=Streptomyces sp. FXJ1.172 TaxID=710705 RepID=UPI0007D01B85|nr:SMI1/KNR4 family protein [Streptomyces sp. FXJ1.172]WEO94652.1 SMI1/KNR4 family protein [Streptomyces sp. FXJ1.172]